MRWDQYFCELDGSMASIVLDMDLRDQAPVPGKPFVLRVRVTMQSPREDGLSSDEEADTLLEIEKSLKIGLGENAIFAGRYTLMGFRSFLFYVGNPALVEQVEPIICRNFEGYKHTAYLLGEPGWETYLGFLYPDEWELQSMANRNGCDALEERGEALDIEREIYHQINFKDESGKAEFLKTALLMGFRERDGQIYRTDVLSRGTIDALTQPLFKLAAEYGGVYAGWKSESIVRPL